jgi:hypothetical protein
MSKIRAKQYSNRKKPEEVVQVLADKHGVTKRHIRMVISGDRKNETILDDYLSYKESHNLLLEAVKKAVPFETEVHSLN